MDRTPIRHFELHTQKGKAFSAQLLEHILEHDNAVKNPIVTLNITFNDKADDPTNSCMIVFGKDNSTINVKIKGEHPKWTNDLFSEIDEQIERAFVSSWVYSIKGGRVHQWIAVLIMLLVMIPASIMPILSGHSTKDSAKLNFMTPADVEYLQRLGAGVKQQEDKVDFIYQMLSRQIRIYMRRPKLLVETCRTSWST